MSASSSLRRSPASFLASSSHALPLPPTASQLSYILTTIQTSRLALIKVVTFLLSECPKSTCTETAPSSPANHLPTLSSLISPPLKGKRKRPITHFDGIPLSAALPPPPTPSSPNAERRIISLRRVMGLYKTMSGVSISGQSQDSNSVKDTERDAYHFACHYMNKSSPSSIESDSEDDCESSTEEEDSDDEDDVVLVFNRPY
ncbi:hypothetical protein C349_01482 [Cryptococcus neoformans var. grubii Br795]|nr:hypothetical protein C353_01406 [Cryptococcus neoformans var. grubii AD1-83a]OXG66065.1 hypothetical protein C354_01417 [Cryptococcus neoformans var. grubii MW-RSA1955]OXG67719.1 hypothetical protein C351_01239 [Cryptococcus neoformans var. grubii c8]OXG70802.1 hypothetical protein C352_01423 [Cryptococcus neoformans var. grubii CHC193]OXG87206.1 hypothetical protein C349_01482 [Cryptococcus neoformans var. grubii Br795]OXG91403.1 hypothetical protein C346_01432 [Cryptococcus neoformans var